MSSAPPMPATKMSPCRQSTAFGWPVVPPVHAMYMSSGEVRRERATRRDERLEVDRDRRGRGVAAVVELDQHVELAAMLRELSPSSASRS